MFHQFELVGVPVPLQRQLWSRRNVRAMTWRRRALRRRLQGIVLAPPQRRHREARHG